MRYAASLYATVAAVVLAVAAGAGVALGGTWAKASPALGIACVAAILVGWLVGRRAMAAVVDRLRALAPPEEPAAEADVDQLLQCLSRRLDLSRDECGRAQDLLSRLPFPCMTVDAAGGLRWRNEAMATLMAPPKAETGPEAEGDPVAAFFARTDARSWANLRSGRWKGPLLRLARPGGEERRLRLELIELGDADGCRLCLFQDVTDQHRDALRVETQRLAIVALHDRVVEGTAALEALAGDINQALSALVGSMHDSKDQARQVAQAMQEMTDNVRMMATMAAETARTAVGAEDQAREGGGIIKQTAQVTHKVVTSYDQLQDTLSQLVERAGNVGSVVGLISDIADQTNLLALNAAIEAARAGDAGRGFAVVADEVRKLAEKTLQATKEVNLAVRAIADCSQRAVAAMRATDKDIRTSFDLVQSVEDRFAAIAAAMVTASRGIDDIAHRAEQQCASSFEINMCAMNVTDNSQEVYDEVQHASRDLERLVTQVAEMRRLAAGAAA